MSNGRTGQIPYTLVPFAIAPLLSIGLIPRLVILQSLNTEMMNKVIEDERQQDTEQIGRDQALNVSQAIERDADQARARPMYRNVMTMRDEVHDGPAFPLNPRTPQASTVQEMQSLVNKLEKETDSWTARKVQRAPGKPCTISPTFDSRFTSTQLAGCKAPLVPDIKPIDGRKIQKKFGGRAMTPGADPDENINRYWKHQRKERKKPRHHGRANLKTALRLDGDTNIYTTAVNNTPPGTNNSRIPTAYVDEVQFLTDRIQALESQLRDKDDALERGMGVAQPPPGFFDDPENPFPEPGGSRARSIGGSRMSRASSWRGASGLSRRAQSQLLGERGTQSRMSGFSETPPPKSNRSRISLL